MASEIRVNKINNRAGLGTVTYTDTGIIVSGIVTTTGLDLNGDIDVDGHANLDNVSVVGLVTITANNSSDGRLRIEGATQGNKIHLHRASGDSVSIRFQNNFGSIYAGLRNGFSSDQRFAISNSGTLGNNTIFQASENYNVIVGTAITLSGTTGNATYAGIITATSFSGDGSSLSNLPAGAPVGGASTNTVFFENDKAVGVGYSITSGKNAMSAGPLTINAGIAVTVPSGSSWTIV